MQPRIRDSLRNYLRDTYTRQNLPERETTRSYLDCALGINPYSCSQDILEGPAPPKELFCSYPAPDPGFINKIIDYWQDVALLSPDNIQLEVGTFGVIERLHKLFIDENSIVLGYSPQFSDYIQDVRCCGGVYEHIALKAENGYSFSCSEFVSAISSRYKLIYLDNPNNPTGQVIPLWQIEEVVKAAYDFGAVVLVDEAYGDFMDKEASAIALTGKYSNVIAARSFTKGFGLAGLRVGYAVMPKELLKPYSLVAHPFPVTSLSQYYAGLALQDPGFLQKCRKNIANTKAAISKSVRSMVIPATHPSTPILTLIHPNPEIDLYTEFIKRQVITTSGEHFPGLGANAVRLRVPSVQDQASIIEIIKDIDSLN